MYAPKKSSFMFIYVDTAESIIALLLTIIVIVIGRMMRIALRVELLSALGVISTIAVDAFELTFWMGRYVRRSSSSSAVGRETPQREWK